MILFTLLLVSGFIGNGIARYIFIRDFGKYVYGKIESSKILLQTPTASLPDYFTNASSKSSESGFDELWLKEFRLLYPPEFPECIESRFIGETARHTNTEYVSDSSDVVNSSHCDKSEIFKSKLFHMFLSEPSQVNFLFI